MKGPCLMYFLFISVAAILKDYIVTRMMTSYEYVYSFFTRFVSTVKNEDSTTRLTLKMEQTKSSN